MEFSASRKPYLCRVPVGPRGYCISGPDDSINVRAPVNKLVTCWRLSVLKLFFAVHPYCIRHLGQATSQLQRSTFCPITRTASAKLVCRPCLSWATRSWQTPLPPGSVS